MPIGYRNAYANLRIAKLNLARDYENLREAEKKIQLALARAYQNVFVTYESIKTLRAQREAFGEQVKANFQEFQAGKITPDLLLEAQRFSAQALQQEYQSVRDYNNALAAFELVKGTIPQHDNVVIAEGALPACASERAVEHQRQRSAALELRERAAPVPLAETHAGRGRAGRPGQPRGGAARPVAEHAAAEQPAGAADPAGRAGGHGADAEEGGGIGGVQPSALRPCRPSVPPCHRR